MTPRVLLLSSYVACGTVGLRATEPPLRHAGIEVIGLPTTVLSNHPGHAHVAGTPIDAHVLDQMIAALDGNGWLRGLDIVVTGYLPSRDSTAVAARLLDRLAKTSPRCRYVCDPVLGDDPGGLYVPQDVAAAIRSCLVPRADLLTPNRFELSYLAEAAVDTIDQASAAARSLSHALTVVTSVPVDAGNIANVLVDAGVVSVAPVARRQHVPHGTGDVMTGLLAAELPAAKEGVEMLRSATAKLTQIVDRSLGRDALDLGVFFRAAS